MIFSNFSWRMVNVARERVVTGDFDMKVLVLTMYNTSGAALSNFQQGGTEFTKKSADPTSRLSSSLGFFHSKLRRKPFLLIRWCRLDRNRNVTHPGPVSPDGFDCQRIKLYTTSSSRTVRALDKDLSDQKLQLKRWGFFNKGTMSPQQKYLNWEMTCVLNLIREGYFF